MGRPSDYDDDIAQEICFLISEGKSLASISKMENMPSISVIFRWLHNFEDFQKLYARARESQANFYAERILEVASTPLIGEKVKTLPDGTKEIITGDCVERSKLEVDALKWLAARLAPKKFGESTTIKGDADNPLIMHLAKALDERMARLPAPAAGPVVDAVARVVADAAAPAALPEEED